MRFATKLAMKLAVAGREWLPGAALLGLLALAALVAPAALLRGYLIGYLGTLNLALGAMAIVLIASLSRAHWVNSIEIPLRAAMATLPGLALLTIPLWFNLDVIFPWAVGGHSADATAAQRWLQPAWLALRSAGVMLAWLLIAAGMHTWSLRQPLALPTRRAAASLIILLLSISLFAVDWIMALVEHHKTTMIGFLLVSEQWVATLALGALWLSRHRLFTPACGRDVGNLLLAAAMFHGYCLFMDYLIVWEANLPHEIIGYLHRDWRLIAIAVALIVALPVALLLFHRIKTRAAALGAVAAMVLLGHLLMVSWLLSPLFIGDSGKYHFGLWDAMTAGLVAVAWLWLFLAISRRIASASEEPTP